jgi:hypothetical protein
MKNFHLYLIVSTFILASCGGGGGGGGGSAPTTPTTPAPTVNLSADPTSVLLESTSTLTWSSTNATSCSASWTSQTGTSGSEAVTITSAGSNSFSITCSGAGGSGSASVTIEGYRETDGVVVDGYISGAEVFIDEDDDWVLDSNENSTTSDNEGKFTIRYANGNLVSIGGTDLDSQTLLDNLLITHKLTGHSDFKAVTPVTSIAAFMEDASLVNAALGIDSSIDVFTFDPVANKGDGGINDYLYEKGNQLTVLAFALQNITNNLNTTTETTQDYFKAITEEIEKEYTETETKVDIETETFITKALDNVIAAKSATIDETAKANTTKALASVLPVIEVKSSDDLTIGVIRFAISTLQTDIQTIADGSASAETVTSYTEDILAYIAEDQNIDADEIAPDISAIADSASTSEDIAVEINVLLNDSYLTSSPISITAANGTHGTTSVASNVVTYDPDADFNGTDTFSYTITQGDKTSSADVTVSIEAVNDVPSIDIASTIQVAENQTAVTTVSVSDVDEDELTLTLGGTDADSFNLSDENVLTFKEAPDYETKISYSITLSLTDGTETVTKEVTIAVTNINDVAPEFTSEATFSAAENQTAIGTVAASDADGDEVTFTVSGSELEITSAGVIAFVSAPDYETKTSYSVTVTASDGTNSTTQDITVNVTNVNESPKISGNTVYTIEEDISGLCSGGDTYGSGSCEVFNITAEDPEDDNLTYSISGVDKDGFQVSSAGKVSTTFGPNYENANDLDGDNEYEITINVSDGSLSETKDIVIKVLNTDEVPVLNWGGQSLFINENETVIKKIDASDPEDDPITISISGTDSGLIKLTDDDVLEFINPPDYESEKKTYSFNINLSANGLTSDFSITVNILNVNDVAPEFTSEATFSAAENQTAIGTVTATDAEGDRITYSISVSDITINSSSGVLTFASAPDYETKAVYSATVTASDGTNSTTQDITVNITNINDNSPNFTSEATFSAAENQTAIGTVAASDADGDEIVYSISGSEITINSSSGVIAFVSAPDYETKTSYSATVTASDGTNSTNQNIIINITDILENSEPIITNLKTQIELQEDDKKFLYTVEATDADGDTIYFQLTGDDANKFTLSSSGDLAFKEIPDYENPTDADTDNIYEINVSVTDIAPSSTSIMPAGKSDQIETNTSNNTEVRVTNFDEDIIGLTLTSIDGNDSTGPKIRLQLVIDSYTNPNSISILYQGPNAGQYWTGAGSPTTDNFKLTYDNTFTAPDSSPSGQWRIRTIRMQTDQGQIEHKQDFLINKGFTTTTDVYNPNSDTNKPQLESISEPVVQGNDSNPDTSITISFEITASDQENAYNGGHSRWESPASEGGWPYKGGWGSTDLSQNPPKTIFTASLDPKTVSGIYKFEDIRLYDKAGNRKMYYCIDYGDEGYKLRSEDYEIVEGAVCTVNIDNPIEDNSKPQLTKFVLTGSTNTEGRKIISHEYEIDNKTSWTDQETSLRRVYLRMSGPISYDIYDGNLPFKGDTLLPLDAPAGTYQVNMFFVTDNALNDNKYYKNEMDELGFTTSVTFD